MIKFLGLRIRTRREEIREIQRLWDAKKNFAKELKKKIDRIQFQPSQRKKRRERSKQIREAHDMIWARGWSAACAYIKAMINKEA